MLTSCVGLVVAAFLNPVPRTLGFVGIGGYILLQHWHIVDAALLAQCVLYVAGAACFVRCVELIMSCVHLQTARVWQCSQCMSGATRKISCKTMEGPVQQCRRTH
jgi:hypothetical protein